MLDLENKRNTEPYDIQGRWYKVFLESTGSAHKITSTDIDGAYVSGNYLFLPEGWHLVDFKIDMNNVATAAANLSLNIRLNTGGVTGVTIPTPAQYDYMDVYIFAYKKG